MRNLCCARERIQFRQEIHINTCKTNASRVRTAKRLRQTLPIFSRIQWTTCFSVKQGDVIFDKRSACSCIVTSEKYYGCFLKNTGVIYRAILVVTHRAEPRMKTCQSKLFFFAWCNDIFEVSLWGRNSNVMFGLWNFFSPFLCQFLYHPNANKRIAVLACRPPSW